MIEFELLLIALQIYICLRSHLQLESTLHLIRRSLAVCGCGLDEMAKDQRINGLTAQPFDWHGIRNTWNHRLLE